MRKFLYHPIIIALLSGCASQTQYVQPDTQKRGSAVSPTEKSTADSAIVEREQVAVWQQVIAGAGRTGFVVENPNQSTWTLQLRYTGDPKDYIDCGRVKSKVKTAKGERNYDFPAAKAYQQYHLQQGGKVFLVDRRMSLDARATLSLEALAQLRTRVKMESQYTATRDQSVQGGGVKPFAMTDKINFGSSDGATFPNAATKCRATGKFESDVLTLVRR